jgi:uncharacterized membrane protein YbhN (UPF0104 family)
MQKKPLIKQFASRYLHKSFIMSVLTNRWVKWIGSLLSLGFCLIFIINNFQRLIDGIQSIEINYLWLSYAWLITFFTVFLGSISWLFLLRGLGANILAVPTLKNHLQANISKYIPGYAWQFVSKGILSAKQGIDLATVGIAITWEFIQIIWTGFCVSLLAYPPFFLNLFNWESDLLVRAVGLFFLVLPFVLAAMKPHWLLQKSAGRESIKLKWLSGSYLSVCLGWIFLGGSLQAFITAIGVVNSVDLPFFIFAFTASLLVGILVIPVPNGLGIREGLMAYFLSQVVSMPIAILAAIFSRLAITLGELIWVIISTFWKTNPME